MDSDRVVIIGGGCAGLSAAYTLKKKGIDFLLFEAGDVPGGRCRTVQQDGYTFSIGAGSTEPQWKTTFQYLDELGLTERVFSIQKQRYGFLKKGKIHTMLTGGTFPEMVKAVPENLRFFFSCFPFRTYPQLIRVFLALWKYMKLVDEEHQFEALLEVSRFTTEEFVLRFGGEEALKQLFHPFLATMVLGRPSDISVAHPISLFSLMNMPIDPQVSFNGALDFFETHDPDDFASCWQTARNNRPDIESLETQAAMLEKDVKIAGGRYLPQIRLELGYHDQNRDYDQMMESFTGDLDRDQRNRYWTAGVTASWELFDGGRAWYSRQKSLNQIYQVREQITQIELEIQEGIRKALFSIAEAKERIHVAGSAMRAARENYAMEERRLDAGLTTIPLLLDAQIRLARAQVNQIQAKLDYQLARAELGFMMGEELSDLGI